MTNLHSFLFGVLPYIALTIFFVGSLLRFDREQYTWRSGSSQLLDKGNMRLASNLFHIGILALFAGHFVGLLTPPEIYHAFGLTTSGKQALAMIAGSIFGLTCLAGLGLLIHRRLTNPRILKTSARMDFIILGVLLAQLLLGLLTVPVSAGHMDGGEMLLLADWAQSIVGLRAGAAERLVGVPLVYQAHIVLGMVMFILFPFSRLVHIWSAPIWYLGRSYQIVRTRMRQA